MIGIVHDAPCRAPLFDLDGTRESSIAFTKAKKFYDFAWCCRTRLRRLKHVWDLISSRPAFVVWIAFDRTPTRSERTARFCKRNRRSTTAPASRRTAVRLARVLIGYPRGGSGLALLAHASFEVREVDRVEIASGYA
jgi:hypothetical protein